MQRDGEDRRFETLSCLPPPLCSRHSRRDIEACLGTKKLVESFVDLPGLFSAIVLSLGLAEANDTSPPCVTRLFRCEREKGLFTAVGISVQFHLV